MSWRRFNWRQGAPSSSGLRPLGRCSTQKPAPCAVVVIDEDDDADDGSDSEVYIVDNAAGKSFPTTSRSQAKKGEGSSGNVIDLDDDEEEEVEEFSGGDKAGPSTAAHGTGSPGATTPGRASPRNRYGLDCSSDSSESDLSDSEGLNSESDDGGASDCEIMDDTSGTARKMWETAASSRKKMPDGVREAREGKATASASSSGSETRARGNADGLFGSEDHLDEDYFQFFSYADCNLNGNIHFADAWNGEQSSTCRAKNFNGPSSVPDAEECLNGNVSDGKETEHGQNSSGSAKDGPTECHLNEEGSQYFSDACKESEQNITGDAKDGRNSSSGQTANECSNRNDSDGKRPSNSESPTLDPDTARDDETAHFHNGPVPEKASDGIQSPHLNQTFVDSFVSAKRVFPASTSTCWNDGSPPISVSTPEKIDERIPEGACSHKDQSPSDAQNAVSGSFAFSQKELVGNPGLGQFTLVQEASNFQDGLIGEREKHKESAEFKRAAEEEWASRQRQLQIQAEEAKKLRKRKKAEALRLLDMEKRQKQRLQEVRESQKKNEEEIELKEQYRGVVRKELEDTERRCRDMATILRVLGIPVEGGEVRAALKQAQVKFHPDRVSRTDIYQQVKAEETFKFISRLKEKLPRFP
ncbi:hypothetical protein EJB05_04434 [Eragrostis curvula]|uniref:J domain-containing protein n=1 Tax=Eragrostis curvula TaxID=38414 RepID=A0A5J9W9H3_9POAL|nr:hypothetical protein EJB05_04434 [Eragrostis curvula]